MTLSKCKPWDGMLDRFKKMTADPEPREGYRWCVVCGDEVPNDEVLFDSINDEPYCAEHAASCAGCDRIFQVTELVDGFCLECKESDPDA